MDKMHDKTPLNYKEYRLRIPMLAFILCVCWVIILGGFLWWEINQKKQSIFKLAAVEARASFNKDLQYRRWSASHGGTYVPITNETPPNPYLSYLDERDISTPSGRELTLVNPAYMVRQVYELGKKQYGIRGHITSLNPIRPKNRPDKWEIRALKAFRRGEDEVLSVSPIDKIEHLRLMRPIITEKKCLKCHAEQGYKEGDIRGGISVSIPLTLYKSIVDEKNKSLIFRNFIILIIGLIGLGLGAKLIHKKDYDRFAALKALQKREEYLKSIFRAAPTGIGVVTDRVFKQVNVRMCKISGYSEEELVGQNARMLYLSDEEYERVGREKYEQIRNHGTGTAETLFKRKDGRIIDVLLSSTPIDLDDLSKGVTFTTLDITERKQAAKALVESEEKYRSIFENALEGFFQSTPEGRFISVNPAFARMLGYASPEELISSIFDIAQQYYVNPEDRRLFMQLLEKDGSVEHFEFRIRCKDGSQIWVSNSTRAIYNPKGKIVRYEGNVNNITLRKQSEDALRESNEKYRSMMEAMKDPVYICSPDFRVEYMNPAMTRRTGRDATGEKCFKAINDLDEKCPWCIHNEVQQHKSFESDIVSPLDDHSYHVSHSPIIHEDGSISKMTVYRDTTDFKKMKTQLQQSQKMEAIGTLAGGIAHDFNNILFPISGYTEMLLQDIPDNSPFHDNLSKILVGTKRAGDLVTQIPNFILELKSLCQ